MNKGVALSGNINPGEEILSVRDISLSFVGVKALTDITFDLLKGEVRAIIGPNGAGKSSMLNVINGFYHPQQGEVWYCGKKRGSLKPHQIAYQGIARTFQNIALFKGMSTLDNIMTGRFTHMKSNLVSQAFWRGPAEREEISNRERVEDIIEFLEIQAIRKTPVGRLPYGLQKRHDMGVVMDISDRVVVLDYGKKIGDGTPDEVRNNQAVIDAYLGVPHE